jgi:hypothetical protein
MARVFECQACGWTGHPSFDLLPSGKLAAQCGRDGCTFVDPSMSPNDFNEGVTNEGARVSTQGAPAAAIGGQKPRAPSPAPAPPQRQASQPLDIIAAMRERAAFLDQEIDRLEMYKAERKQIARMLAVANRKHASLDMDIQ